VKIPATIRQYVPLPTHSRSRGIVRFVMLQDIIRNNLGDLFPGLCILEQIATSA
jgi:polyphosphate kinase